MSYDPSEGRWTARDPIGLEGEDPNLDRFVGNSPTNFTDPTGLRQYPPLGLGATARNLAEAERIKEISGVMKDMVFAGDFLHDHYKGNVPPFTTKGGAVYRFPNRMWPQYRDAIQYSLDKYVNCPVKRIQVQPITSLNPQGIYIPTGVIIINSEEFYGPIGIAIQTFVHEPQHDLNKLGPGHKRFEDLVPLAEPHPNAHQEFIDYLDAIPGPGGMTYWKYLVDRNNPK